MNYSVYTHKYGVVRYETFNEVMAYFSNKFFKTSDTEVGRSFLRNFGNYIEASDFPCNRIVLQAFTGYSDIFGLSLEYNQEKIAYIQIKCVRNGLFEIYSKSYEKKDFMLFHHVIEEYFDKHNNDVLNKWKELCNITKDNEIEIEKYVNYELKDVSVLKGTLENIFNDYTTINDTYRYCNGHYIRFKDKNIQTLYIVFVDCFKGNYFLANAVKRGVLID